MLKEALPLVPHVQHKDRFHAGKLLLLNHPETDLILLDDGFQHRRLYRDLNLLLCDASDPFGGGYCLPLGRLREPVDAVKRAGHILLTRAERCRADWLDQVSAYFRQNHPDIPVSRCATTATGLETLDGDHVSNPDVGHWLAFSAIGDPSGFRHTLEKFGLKVAKEVRYRDHHHFSALDMSRLASTANKSDCTGLVCTAKDAVKVRELELPAEVRQRIHVLGIDLDLPAETILRGFNRD